MHFLRQIVHALFQTIKQRSRQWAKPDNHTLVLNTALDLTRPKSELILENLFLRQQLMVLKRQTNRPKLTWRDRTLLVFLASKLRTWKEALIIVQPETVLRWHRELFRRFWKHKSKPRRKQGRPALTDDLVALIKRIVKENPTCGKGPRFLIRDNDNRYGNSFGRVARGTGIEVLKTPYRAPKANAICEHFLGSPRRECLDHFLILSERHLSRIVKEYRDYYDHSRPHQGIGQRIPCRPKLPEAWPVSGKLSSRPVLHGLHHDYYWRTPGSVGQGSSPLQGCLH